MTENIAREIDARKALAVAREIGLTMLRGRGGGMQGAILASLVATYFNGVKPGERDQAIMQWLVTVQQLMECTLDPWDYRQ